MLKNKKNKIKNNGFVAILAVLIVSLMLAMLVGITTNSYKEFSLASFAKESKYAFFASDTGMECAQYYDNRGEFSQSGQSPNIKCAGKQVNDLVVDGQKTTFEFNMSVGKNNGVNRISCVKVIVEKDFQYQNFSHTKIQSFGYNKECAIVNANIDKSIVERALRMLYENDVIVP